MPDPTPAAPVRAVLETSAGTITVELDAALAPLSVANFLQYADEGHYNGTVFHRVIRGFMIQGGGLDANLRPRRTRDPIRNEARNGLRNRRGTLAMARTSDVDSATSQFFINLADNAFLDNGSRDFGYAVFGRVVEGMEVVDGIATTPTTTRGGHQDVPATAITLISVRRA